MEMSDLSEDDAKKKAMTGRMSDVMKKLRASSHVTGPDCECLKRCFERVDENQRRRIIREFNDLGHYNSQAEYLARQIRVMPIARRRPRCSKTGKTRSNFASYSYEIPIVENDEIFLVKVCFKAFLSVHGITPHRLQIIQKSLVTTGLPPIDKRGKHKNRPRKLPQNTLDAVQNFIKSFDHESHFSDDINIAEMHRLYSEEHPNLNLSYESFRSIFEQKLDENNLAEGDSTVQSKNEFFTERAHSFISDNDAINVSSDGFHEFDEASLIVTKGVESLKKFNDYLTDESQIFGNFVASQMRTMSEEKRRRFQMFVQKGLLDF